VGRSTPASGISSRDQRYHTLSPISNECLTKRNSLSCSSEDERQGEQNRLVVARVLQSWCLGRQLPSVSMIYKRETLHIPKIKVVIIRSTTTRI
jgi:hypothetical protein